MRQRYRRGGSCSSQVERGPDRGDRFLRCVGVPINITSDFCGLS